MSATDWILNFSLFFTSVVVRATQNQSFVQVILANVRVSVGLQSGTNLARKSGWRVQYHSAFGKHGAVKAAFNSGRRGLNLAGTSGMEFSALLGASGLGGGSKYRHPKALKIISASCKKSSASN
jgi:hypothetical protein